MSKYTEDTFRAIWYFTSTDKNTYTVLHNITSDTYHLYHNFDIEEKSYSHLVYSNYTKLNGVFYDEEHYFYIVVNNNAIHCETEPAAFVPGGLNNFRPNQDIKHYVIYGKIMSQYSWLTWVKHTTAWPQAMAGLLGAKSY